jgi:hypothetical protein
MVRYRARVLNVRPDYRLLAPSQITLHFDSALAKIATGKYTSHRRRFRLRQNFVQATDTATHVYRRVDGQRGCGNGRKMGG